MTICTPNQEVMTKQEAKERFRGVRNLKIETDENGIVTEVTASSPCIVCGKYHRFLSKPSEKCALRIIGIIRIKMEECYDQIS